MKLNIKEIKKCMIDYNYTQEELAKRLKVSQVTVNNWLTGKSLPALKQLFKIAKVFNKKSIDEFLKV